LGLPVALKKFVESDGRLGEHLLFHYAWVIVAVGAVGQMAGSSIRLAFGVVVDPLVKEFGWSAGSVGFGYALMSVVTALFSPVAGWLGTRFGARRTMSAGVALFLVGMLWTSQVSHLWELYVAYGLLFGTAQAMFLVPVVPAVASWFRRHLGLGTGVMMISWSLGPAVVVQAMALMFQSVGWSQTFIITGVAGASVMAVALLLFRDTPEQAGKTAYGWREGDRPLVTSGEQYREHARRFQKHIYGTNAFWNLINVHFLGCAGHAVILVGLVPMAIHRGMSPVGAAGVLTTVSAVSVIMRFMAPVLSDRIGSKGVMFFSFFGQGAGVLLFLMANTPAEFYLFAVVWAIPFGGEGTAFPVINRQYYGHAPMGPTYGWQLLGAGLGMALGGVIPGVLFDFTGGYTWAIVLSAGFSLAGAAAIILLEPTRRLLIPDWERLSGQNEQAGEAHAAAARVAAAVSPGD
jgi:MFS family permease